MADSIREQIIQAVVARLGVIAEVNGYSMTVGAVERAVVQFAEDCLPAISVWPGDEETVTGHGYSEPSMTITIEVFRDACGANHSVIGEQSMTDLKRAMLSREYWGDGLALLLARIEREGGTIKYPDAGGDIVANEDRYIITYREVTGSPDQSPEI